MDAVAGRHHEPVAGTGEFNGLIPTATPENFELALTRRRGIGYCLGGIRSEPIAAPFTHVAVHVVQSTWIDEFLTDRIRGCCCVFRFAVVFIGFASAVADADKAWRA